MKRATVKSLKRDLQWCQQVAAERESIPGLKESFRVDMARLNDELTKARDKVTELRVEISARDELIRKRSAELETALEQKRYETTRHAATQVELGRAMALASERGKIMSVLVEKIRELEKQT